MKPPLVLLTTATLRRLMVWLLCLASGTILCQAAGVDDTLPQMPPAKRYDKLVAHSPFAPPTAPLATPGPTATPPPGPSWSDNLTVTSLMQFGNVYTATVVEKDTSARHFIRSDVEDLESHLLLANVRWADKSDAIKVTVRKGNLTGELRFDPGAASGGGLPGAPPAPVPRPGMPNPAANFHPPPPIAAAAMNPPPGNIVRGRPVIHANPPVAPVRPVVTSPALQNRVAPAVKPSKDDDDDDDDN